MRTPILTVEDELRRHWRLVLREPSAGCVAAVILEHIDEDITTEWVEMEVLTHDLADAGVSRSFHNVIIVDDKKSRAMLDAGMAKYSAVRRLDLSGPVPVGFRRMNLLEFIFELEGIASSSGLAESAPWAPGLTRIVAHGEDGKARVIADQVDTPHILHIVSMQPAAAAAMARKLREAWYLLNATSRAIAMLRPLAGLEGRLPDKAAHSEALVRLGGALQSISERIAEFTTIDVPAIRGMP